jgi:sodium-dependent dicarboxylate transporter 2/3/5
VIILLGGGFALAEGAERSCLTAWAGEQLGRLSGLSPQLLRVLICLLVSLITQIASNAATASMLLPVLLQLSQQLQLNPLYLMLPATLTTSLAFMLPVSTAPNAIVAAASGMSTSAMLKPGIGKYRSLLKGRCHEIDTFLKVQTFLSVLSVYALMVFKVLQKLFTIL